MVCLWSSVVSEQILPGVRIIIANPETKGPMGESHLGEVCLMVLFHHQRPRHVTAVCDWMAEVVYFHVVMTCSQIWVHSGHNASGYFTVYGDEALQSDHFNSRLSFGDTQTIWARTGYLGFLRRTELTDASGGERATQKVGSLEPCSSGLAS